jgi:hypothetical protein
MKTKRTEVTIEVEEVVLAVNDPSRFAPVWCPDCGSEVQMISPEQAAMRTQATVRAINQRVEDGSVHFVETPDGRLWVCVSSLSERRVVPEPIAVETQT